ncbi:hypothetical protein AHAS_Ahas03G0381900 [Arachis hypogaea]
MAGGALVGAVVAVFPWNRESGLGYVTGEFKMRPQYAKEGGCWSWMTTSILGRQHVFDLGRGQQLLDMGGEGVAGGTISKKEMAIRSSKVDVSLGQNVFLEAQNQMMDDPLISGPILRIITLLDQSQIYTSNIFY